MIDGEDIYKILHYSMIFLLVGGIGATFWGNYDAKSLPRSLKIITGVSSFFILVAGMGLIVRSLGLTHGADSSWPMWIKVKLFLWIGVAVGVPILSKRVRDGRRRIWVGISFIFVIMLAAVLATIRPAF